MRSIFGLMIFATVIMAAPVPKTSASLDPLGRGYMGVYANRDGTSGESTLIIESVIPNSSAAKAGLLAGDRFVEVGPIRPKSFDEVRMMIGSLRPGTTLDLLVLRNGQELRKTITLGDRPSDFDRGTIIEP